MSVVGEILREKRLGVDVLGLVGHFGAYEVRVEHVFLYEHGLFRVLHREAREGRVRWRTVCFGFKEAVVLYTALREYLRREIEKKIVQKKKHMEELREKISRGRGARLLEEELEEEKEVERLERLAEELGVNVDTE